MGRTWTDKEWEEYILEEYKALCLKYKKELAPIPCACHCHMEERGALRCRCIKNCIHCHPENFKEFIDETDHD